MCAIRVSSSTAWSLLGNICMVSEKSLFLQGCKCIIGATFSFGDPAPLYSLVASLTTYSISLDMQRNADSQSKTSIPLNYFFRFQHYNSYKMTVKKQTFFYPKGNPLYTFALRTKPIPILNAVFDWTHKI